MTKAKGLKKLLSVLLSVLLLMSTGSAAFTVFADDEATDVDVWYELAEAIKSDTVKNFATYATAGTGTYAVPGTNTNYPSHNCTITVPTYAMYREIADLLTKLDAALKSLDSYAKYNVFPSGESANSRMCIDTDTLRDDIQATLLVSNYITDNEFAEYNGTTFLTYVLDMEGAVLHANAAETKSDVSARYFNYTTVTTTDYQGYLAQLSSYEDIDDPIVLGTEYLITMSRESYKGRCGDEYHHAINTTNGVPTVSDSTTAVNTTVKTVIDDYLSYLDTVDLAMSYTTLLDMVSDNTMDAFFTTFNGKYTDIVEFVGSEATFNSLFGSTGAAVVELIKGCNSAMQLEAFLAIADRWQEFSENNPDYGVFNYGAYEYDPMVAAYSDFMQIYNQLAEGGSELLAYLNERNEIDLNYYTNFTDNVAVYDLATTAAAAEALYNQHIDSYQLLTAEEQQAVYSQLSGYLSAIKTYSEQVVNAIYPNGYANLIDLNEKLYCATNEYVAFFSSTMGQSYIDAATSDIQETVNDVEANIDGLHQFFGTLADELGTERATELLGSLIERADGFAMELLTLLAARFESQITYADGIYTALGRPTQLDVPTFIKLKAAFGGIEDIIYNFLGEKEAADLIDEDILALYGILQDEIYNEYLAFAATYGFAAYEQTQLTYESRDVYINDKVKTDSYDVTAENLENVIAKLDEFLTGDDFTDLIGGTDLATLLTEKLEGVIFSDSFINTIVNLLYPLVIGEFENVWADLPSQAAIEKPVHTTVNITYTKTLHSILDDVDLNIYPDLLGAALSGDYSETKASLIAAGSNWRSSAIYDRAAGELTLNWGVDEAENKSEAFYEAFAAAMSGLKPLIMAILCGQDWSMTSSGMASTTVIILPVSIDLTLSASGNNGYVNALGPIFEALGYYDIPDAEIMNSYTDLQDVAKAIFEPIFGFIGQFGSAPVETVLAALPNLLYALSFDMATPILSMLKTSIGYAAIAAGESAMSDSIDIDIGQMLDLESMGVDLSQGLGGILALLGIEIPEIDASVVSTLGSLAAIETVRQDWIYDNSALAPGTAYTIDADMADMAYYALGYLAGILNDKEALGNILGAFDIGEDTLATINNVVDALDINSAGDAIAAVTELLNEEKYPEADFVYPQVDSVSETIVKENFYTPFWTEPQAQYVADNLIPFVEKLFDIIGMDISDELGAALKSLYTRDNMTSLTTLITNALNGLVGSGTAADVIEVLTPLLSLDIPAILAELNAYTVPEFEDGDRDAFVDAFVAYAMPLIPVLKLFVLDDSTLQLADSAITLNGYNGYNSAVIPVLEALGCDPATITPYAQFKTLDDEAMLRAVLNPIVGLLDATLAENPVENILALLPNILFFIDSDGLQQAVDNLLRPIYVVLDVIRPIKNVDLTVSLGLEELLTDALASLSDDLSLKFPGYSQLSSILKSLGTATTYTSATGKEAVRLQVSSALTPEFVTLLLRTVIKTVVFSTNTQELIDYIRENSDFSDSAKDDIEALLLSLADIATDEALFVVFFAFFGVNTGADALIDLRTMVAGEILAAFNEIGFATSDEFKEYVKNISDLLLSITGSVDDLFDNNGDNSITGFLQKILDFFRNIIERILAVFKL